MKKALIILLSIATTTSIYPAKSYREALLNTVVTVRNNTSSQPVEADLDETLFTVPSKEELMKDLKGLENFDKVTGCISKVAGNKLLGVQAIETRWQLSMHDYCQHLGGSWITQATPEEINGIKIVVNLTARLKPVFYAAVLKKYPQVLQELRNHNKI